MSISPDLINASTKFSTWMQQQALPLWSQLAIDPDTAGSYERLKPDGQPDSNAKRRARVQCRQIFSFSLATQMGWLENGEGIVDGLQNYLDKYARRADIPGMYVHLLDDQHQPCDLRLDLYDIAFFLLSCASRYQLNGDDKAVEQADQIMTLIDSRLKNDSAGWQEGDYAAPARRQNPHMHLLEAFMFWYEATGNGKWLARAGQVVSLFETVFYAPQHGILHEYFTPRWQLAAGNAGQVVEPGHMLEWVWLLNKYQQLTGIPTAHYGRELYRSALNMGRIEQSGLLYDEITPQGEVLKASKRLWPLTELLKASLCQAAAGDKTAEQVATRAIDTLMKYYLRSDQPGSYIDQLDDADQVCVNWAPTSSLYHLMLACSEAHRYCHG